MAKTPITIIVRLNSEDGQHVGYDINTQDNLVLIPPDARENFQLFATAIKIKIRDSITAVSAMSQDEVVSVVQVEIARVQEEQIIKSEARIQEKKEMAAIMEIPDEKG
jgi:hypothetical protein